MAPAWALGVRTRAPVPVPPPASPSLTNMVFWVLGDVELESAAGIVTAWRDQAGQNQDLDVTVAGKEPETGLATIDSIPTATFGEQTAGSFGSYIRRASVMKDRNGNPMLPSTVRTIFAVMLPATGTAGIGFPLTGGPVFAWQDVPNFEAMFSLDSFFAPDRFVVFDNAWIASAVEIRGPDTPAVVYDGVPTLAMWAGAADTGASVAVEVDGVPIATTPATSAGLSGAGNSGFLMGNAPNISGVFNNACFEGSIAECIVYDYDIRTSPAALAQTLAYFAGRYPSLGM